jgi:hypothetical protein
LYVGGGGGEDSGLLSLGDDGHGEKEKRGKAEGGRQIILYSEDIEEKCIYPNLEGV